MAVIALVMMRSFMYEGSRPVVMFTFMLVLCIITRSLKARVAAPVNFGTLMLVIDKTIWSGIIFHVSY